MHLFFVRHYYDLYVRRVLIIDHMNGVMNTAPYPFSIVEFVFDERVSYWEVDKRDAIYQFDDNTRQAYTQWETKKWNYEVGVCFLSFNLIACFIRFCEWILYTSIISLCRCVSILIFIHMEINIKQSGAFFSPTILCVSLFQSQYF